MIEERLLGWWYTGTRPFSMVDAFDPSKEGAKTYIARCMHWALDITQGGEVYVKGDKANVKP